MISQKPLCDNCQQLIGKPSSTPPHTSLSASGAGVQNVSGKWEKVHSQWICADCGNWMYQATERGSPPSEWRTGEAPADLPGGISGNAGEHVKPSVPEDEFDEDKAEARAYYEKERQRQKKSWQFLSSGLILLVAGSLFLLSGYKGGLLAFIVDWQKYLGGVMLALAFIAFIFAIGVAQSRFIDVDLLRRRRRLSPADAWPFPTGNTLEEDEELVTYRKRDSFERYFFDLKETLENKANDADKKASILLDKGTTYTRWGIFFFLASIVSWQVVSHFFGFKTEYIYGIISCSALFIFIEFLSAWFLKQYRQYVDTSTYLLKVKAIFDRYMLVYLANRGMSGLEEDEQKRAQFMLEQLSKEIAWPDSYLLKKQDVGFAKDAIKAIGGLAKELRRKEKEAKAKE
ncbi:hypothetical protein [Cupriavidus alkaliphilus]|uniref:hypothetical protein n=1 Tax=Cupriavidus alkaliphilus TaxID=942866 RepID=UPI001610BD8B|nr:hypothetical protein [Cupriavidus alkaliphilus]MBB3012044.1 hypothetical protein [Cupriavidus alkaliphilus]